MTRPIAREQRITGDRRHVVLFGIAALVIAGAIAGALFLLPVRTWFEQDDQLVERRAQLAQLEQVNSDLLDEVTRLQTEDGIREAAREELGLIDQDEDRLSLRGVPPLPGNLPDGWPYSPITRIIELRSP
jgi:cell division protein FtsB